MMTLSCSHFHYISLYYTTKSFPLSYYRRILLFHHGFVYIVKFALILSVLCLITFHSYIPLISNVSIDLVIPFILIAYRMNI